MLGVSTWHSAEHLKFTQISGIFQQSGAVSSEILLRDTCQPDEESRFNESVRVKHFASDTCPWPQVAWNVAATRILSSMQPHIRPTLLCTFFFPFFFLILFLKFSK